MSFFGTPDSISSAAVGEVRWADAYHLYASDAEDISGDGVVSANRRKFLEILDFGGKKTAAETAQNFDRAFIAYWTGAVFGVGSLIVTPPIQCPDVNPGGSGVWASETTSVVVAVTQNILARLLRPIFERSNESDTAYSKAQEIAQAFHEATTTAVFVLITGLDTTPGPTGPLPITNTCTIN